jgi:hypothetical protein
MMRLLGVKLRIEREKVYRKVAAEVAEVSRVGVSERCEPPLLWDSRRVAELEARRLLVELPWRAI